MSGRAIRLGFASLGAVLVIGCQWPSTWTPGAKSDAGNPGATRPPVRPFPPEQASASSPNSNEDELTRRVKDYAQGLESPASAPAVSASGESAAPEADHDAQARTRRPLLTSADGAVRAAAGVPDKRNSGRNGGSALAGGGADPQGAPAPPVESAPPTAAAVVEARPVILPPRVISMSAAPARTVAVQSSRDTEPIANRPAQASGAGAAGLTIERRDLESAAAANPNDFDVQTRVRLAWLAEGMDAKALQPTPGMTRETEDLVLGLVRVAQAARSGAGRDTAQWADRQLGSLEEYRAMLQQRADLRVPRVALCREVQTFGVYDEISPAEFPAGVATPVIVYVEVSNFRSDKTPTGYHTQLEARLSILDRSGQEVWTQSVTGIEDQSRQRRADFFYSPEVRIPATLGPGDYTLKVTMTDVQGRKSNENKAEFRIAGK